MRSYINIHVGQAGCQIGHALWELLCFEHGVQADGRRQQPCPFDGSSFFDTNKDRYSARAIMCDAEPTVIDEVRNGPYRSLFRHLISGKESSAGNFAIGYYQNRQKLLPPVLDSVRSMVEDSSFVEGIILYHSLGGGTGSGFTSLLTEHLRIEYPKIPLLNMTVYPSPLLATGTVEPYNAVLGLHKTAASSGAVIVLDNEAMYYLGVNKFSGLGNKSSPSSYTQINRLAVQVISSITAGIRFDGSLNRSIADISTNLIPYPDCRFLIPSYAPIYTSQSAARSSSNSLREITRQVFKPENRFVKVDCENHPYLAATFLYRGNVNEFEAEKILSNSAVGSQFEAYKLHFGRGTYMGFNSQPPATIPGTNIYSTDKAVTMLGNNPAIKEKFIKLGRKFDSLYSKKAFVQSFYNNGATDGVFNAARLGLRNTIERYEYYDKISIDDDV